MPVDSNHDGSAYLHCRCFKKLNTRDNWKEFIDHEITILLASVIIMGTLGVLSFKRIKAV
jgi:hypothetical protein